MTQLNKLLVLLMCFAITIQAKAQDIFDKSHATEFANYLFREGQYKLAAIEYERIYFLDPKDSSNYSNILLAWRYSGETAASYAFGESHFKSFYATNKTVAKEQVFNKMLLGQNDIKSFLDISPLSSYDKNTYYLSSLLIQERFNEAHDFALTTTTINKSIVLLSQEADELHYKSPFIAAAMSTVLPGSGKVYAGYWKDGLMSLIFTSLTAFQAYRGFKRKGTQSALGWIYGAIGTGFYIGNIYGSFHTAKRKNKAQKHTIVEKTIYSTPGLLPDSQ